VNHDRRSVMLLVWLAIAAGTMAAAELVYLLIHWATG
jgi:hypothetical protein